jgi:hypothetical protein
MIKAKEFLDIIFEEMPDDEVVCVSRQMEKKGGGVWFKNHTPSDRQFRRHDPDKQDQAWYFCVSSVDGALNEKGTMIQRGRVNIKAVYCLVLDDIGTKAEAPPVEPSWKITTSIVDGVPNEQWGYMLERYEDLARYEALLEYCHGRGWGDAGAGGSYRLMRVPGSANLKPGRQMYKAEVTHWEPTVWPAEELAVALGCDFSTIAVKELSVTEKTGGATAMDGIDPLLDWLVDNGSVVKDGKGEWVDLVCPWADQHTTGENMAGYSPLGRGAGDWVQTRGFKCLHEHCVDKKIGDLVKWAEEKGGPFVSGYDPLPWLQSRYAYVGMDMKVADMVQRKLGGEWLWDYIPWAKRHPGKIAAAGEKNKIKIADAFVASGGTRHVDYTTYVPVAPDDDAGIVDVLGQSVLNTYVPPNWVETTDLPEMFLEHMAYVLPSAGERELFLNWLAYKIQHPGSRSYAMVMVAAGVYGTGRSWIKDMLGLALQGKINTTSLAALVGCGTSSEQTYNSWLSRCQFLVVEEAKETIDRDVFYHSYETFKLNVDTRVREERINPKFGRTRTDNIYFNALIFSNHADAMAFPENDRRICVLTNPSEMNTPEYYERLAAATNKGEAARLFWFLMHRDVSQYDSIYPPMTPGKEAMLENNRMPSDVLLDYIVEITVPDLVTKKSLKVAVARAAAKLDFDGIAMKPGPVVNAIWSKLGTLKEVKNGFRVTLDGIQQGTRAVRNRDHWKQVAHVGDVAAALVELGRVEPLAEARLSLVP